MSQEKAMKISPGSFLMCVCFHQQAFNSPVSFKSYENSSSHWSIGSLALCQALHLQSTPSPFDARVFICVS